MMRKAKTRPETRFDKVILLLLNNSWQGLQYANGTFEELEKIDVLEIRELLDDADEQSKANPTFSSQCPPTSEPQCPP